MAENTRLKDITAELKNLSIDVKRMMEMMELCHVDYSMRFENMETSLAALKSDVASSQSPGQKNSNASAFPFQVRNVKLYFPRFNGSNALEWIFKAEQFFTYYNILGAQCLNIVAVHMDVDVIPWFQMMDKNTLFQSWVGFTRALELEFGPSPYEAPQSLFKLNQLGFVQESHREFTVLANRVYGITPNALLDCFIDGLRSYIQRDVIAQEPTSMLCAVSLAKLYEAKYVVGKNTVSSPTSSTNTLAIDNLLLYMVKNLNYHLPFNFII